MWFNICLCLSGWCRKMHLCVDYFVTDSPAHSPRNVWRRSVSAWIFWLSIKERRILRKQDYKGRLSFHFFDRWMTVLATYRKKSPSTLWKICRCSNSAFFTWSWMGLINCAPNPYNRVHYIDDLTWVIMDAYWIVGVKRCRAFDQFLRTSLTN